MQYIVLKKFKIEVVVKFIFKFFLFFDEIICVFNTRTLLL